MSIERLGELLLQTTPEDREEVAAWLYRRGMEASELFPKLLPEQAYERALERGGSQRLQEIASRSAEYAYLYARDVDTGPCDITRKGASRKGQYAQRYALDVDKGPHEVTREGACRCTAAEALYYARHVDRGPHDVTRRYASQVATVALAYAREIDKGPHEVTRAGVVNDAERFYFAYQYAAYVEKGFHPVTWDAVQGSWAEEDYRREVGVPEGEGDVG